MWHPRVLTRCWLTCFVADMPPPPTCVPAVTPSLSCPTLPPLAPTALIGQLTPFCPFSRPSAQVLTNMLCSKQHEQEFVDINLSLATVLNDLNLALQPLYDVSAGCLNGACHAPYMPVGLYIAVCRFSYHGLQVAALPSPLLLQATPIVTISPLAHLRPQAQSIQCADSMGPSAGAAGRPTPAPSSATSVDGIPMTQDGFGDGATSSGPKVGTGWNE